MLWRGREQLAEAAASQESGRISTLQDKQLSVSDEDQQWLIYQWQCIKIAVATLYLSRERVTLTSQRGPLKFCSSSNVSYSVTFVQR